MTLTETAFVWELDKELTLILSLALALNSNLFVFVAFKTV